MSTLMKLIIPLLDDSITKEDISEESKFIDAFAIDINRPTLDNHIFLLYKCDTSNKTAMNRYIKFNNLKSLYSQKTIYINQIPYTIYTFPRINSTINKIIRRCDITHYSDCSRILKFWKGEDDDVNRILLYGGEELIKRIDKNDAEKSVPEKDYAIIRNISQK